jgi:hypothetical protein
MPYVVPTNEKAGPYRIRFGNEGGWVEFQTWPEVTAWLAANPQPVFLEIATPYRGEGDYQSWGIVDPATGATVEGDVTAYVRSWV